MNRIVWILREQRAGSTWFTLKLSNFLNKKSYFLDSDPEYLKFPFSKRKTFFINRIQQQTDYNKILNTHDFYACRGLKNYENPLVFRVSRRNKTEQFLSNYLADILYQNKLNMNIFSNKEIENFPKYKNLFVTKDFIFNFIDLQNQIDWLWQSVSDKYETEVVYYEDLLESFNSKIISNLSLSMKNDNSGQLLPMKMPYDKKVIFKNYDEVEEYINRQLKVR